MSLTDGIFNAIFNYHSRGFRVLYEDVYELKRAEQSEKSFERTLRSTLSRMKRKGLLKNVGGKWSITSDGLELLNGRNSDIKRYFPAPRHRGGKVKRSLIIIFDIPEKIRRYRDWLRPELENFGFKRIQDSVWFGPPLPKEFLEFLDEYKLLRYIRFFKATEDDLI
ncbi:MAG: hypothetical protein A2758_02090 [Candidatus Zambryskibacteria bacterium RIFCSPHIGHO2_01_FULL_49_18]|uniref:Transcriptional repressor PaaX-like central Cas2-like domain-containing protein n=2 Tax=Candidatus Zambryskiibacteriota TaxID=1817925 RepID=A0A1G2T2K3_9BACT|nr:MAG: hypothetical protein A2758_02090 [Candidatus Zambryskibacteria bacterium RIFCSPHIGHO2_01_FULL_49_18]OHB06120.1 MAG: hypothetical protein A3A26_01045 [Candidatus Zambryskibacteria bacterium RIFCSPLOWO2_01_FULL_47_14]